MTLRGGAGVPICTAAAGRDWEGPEHMKRARESAMEASKVVGKFQKGQPVLVNEAEFSEMCEQMREYDATRESDLTMARSLLKTAEEGAKDLLPIVQKDESLRYGSFANACEEYVEARTFEHFLSHGTLMSLKELEFVDRSEYLGGLADLTGEIARYAVIRATKRDVVAVEHCKVRRLACLAFQLV